MLFESEKSLCGLNDKIIVCKENQSEYRAENLALDNVYKFKIDGDILSVSDSSVRCDYLVENETKKHAYFIELKGSDITHAIEQIEATINKYKGKLTLYEIKPRIIYKNNTHDIKNSKVRQFKSKYKSVVFKTTMYSEKI